MSTPAPHVPEPDLHTRGARMLRALDAVVRKDGADPQLLGRIAVGVRDDEEHWTFWCAEFRPTGSRVYFAEELPPSNCALVMDVETAEAVIEGRPTPDRPALLAVEGDTRLLEAFFERYFTRRSWLDIRMGK